MRARRAAIIALIAATICGCLVDPPPARDGSPSDHWPFPQDGPQGGEGANAAGVDFVVQGCASQSASLCLGSVPLSLVFSAVFEKEPKNPTWDFGDAAATKIGPVVSHTYKRPGTYDVTLTVPEGSGTLSERKSGFVKVSPVGPGQPCDSVEACQIGTCVCKGTCTFPLSEGICLKTCGLSTPCPLAGSGGELVCVDLSVPVPTSSTEPWRTQLCLPSCTKDSQCRAGFSCRLAPTHYAWKRACLPPLPRFMAQPCRLVSGATDASLCVGKTCLDIGASGYCSAACQSGTCPAGSRCATFNNDPNSPFCLALCASGSSVCQNDPLLNCELPTTTPKDAYDFLIIGPADPKGTRYCAPRRCKADSDCGLGGSCDLAQGGFCLPQA